MMIKTKYLLMIIVLLLSELTHADTSKMQLSKNPFVKPVFVNETTDTNRVMSEPSNILSDSSLRATLSSDERSIANVDGLMIFIGEKIKGYELISVGEGSATFLKNGKKITLHVSEMHKKLK